MLAISLIIGRFNRRNPVRMFASKYYSWVLLMAFIIYLFRFENVAYFDNVVWLYGTFILLIVGLILVIVKNIRLTPVLMEQKQKVVEYNKYLPKTKKKRPVKEKNG
jgi:hypothetical protein